MAPTARLHRGTFTATVDVDIDIADLEDCGWHHEDDCKNSTKGGGSAWISPVIASLHRQAHPRETLSVRGCHEEPCRSLTLDQIGQVDDGD